MSDIISEIAYGPDNLVFGLDIGTRSIVGTVGYMDNNGFHVTAMEVKEHDTRAMIDGQVHDIVTVGEEIAAVKSCLEERIGKPLTRVCIAAAGRVLRTVSIHEFMDVDEEVPVTEEDVYNLELRAVDHAHRTVNSQEKHVRFYCVGYTTVKYLMNGYEIKSLAGHKTSKIGVDLLATFLPGDVVDGLYSAVEMAGLEVANLTLEPIAAMNVAIPEQYRLLNIALVDVGAGTSDICITKDGSITGYGMIPSAGDEISEMIAKHYLVDFNQAEKIKIAACGKKKVNFKDVMGTKITVTPEEIIELTSPITRAITKDVADKIKELNGDKNVKAVFVVGGGGKFPGFTKFLAEHLDIPEARVALRGKEVLEDVEFAITNHKKDPLFVTPVGICINYYSQKNRFIYVTVNGEYVKLYDNNNLTVIDALTLMGFPEEKLFPRRGKSVTYTFNGVERVIRGTIGEPAIIKRNNKECNVNSKIEKNDEIEIKESTIGVTPRVKLKNLNEFKKDFNVEINGTVFTCPRFAFVNGNMETSEYLIKEGDSIEMNNFYTIKELFEIFDIDVEDYDILVNNEGADADTRVYENFKIEYKERDYYSGKEYLSYEPDDDYVPSYKREKIEAEASVSAPADIVPSNDSQTTDETTVASSEPEVAAVPETPAPPVDTTIVITVNKTPVVLTGKPSYLFVDIFDFYPFDLTKMGGKELITKLNGERAEFVGPIYDGCNAEIYWKQ